MDSHLLTEKQNVIDLGKKQALSILKDKRTDSLLNGKYFLKGVIKGFDLCESFFCLEQLERFILFYINEEQSLLKKMNEKVEFEDLINNSKPNPTLVRKLAFLRGVKSTIMYLYEVLNVISLRRR